MDKDYFKKYYKTFKSNIIKITGETKQNKIATILNVTESTLSRWFAGTAAPTLADLLEISSQYNYSIDWLLGNDSYSKNTYSVYDICKILSDIDSQLPFIQESSKISRPLKKQIDLFKEKDVYGNVETIYSCLHFQDKTENGISYTLAGDEINDFLVKFDGLKKARKQKLIDDEIFKDAVRAQLNKLSKEKICYTEYTFSQIPDIDEDLPFN